MSDQTPIISVTMAADKKTRGTVVYREVTEDGAIPTLYIRKTGIHGHPNKIRVDVTIIDE